MPRPSYPRNVADFNRTFPDKDSCVAYLAACRWPDGFRCPDCGHDAAFELPPVACGSASRAGTRPP